MTPADLRAARTRLNLTQAEFSRALRVERSTVMRWEDGTRAIPEMAVIVLGMVRDVPGALAWLMERGRACG